MNRTIFRIFLFLILILFLIPVSDSKSFPIPGKSEFSYQLYYYFDLRDRESYIQVTNNDSASVDIHVQIFRTDFSCNENDFFDEYTQDDTHIYNLRDIQTNSGLPSGVVLPDNSYGFVAVTVSSGIGGLSLNNPVLSGNFRIVDDSGYEYRSVAASFPVINSTTMANTFSFNFSPSGTNTFADVIGIAVGNIGEGEFGVIGRQASFDLAIIDINENPESCPPETFSCASNIGLNQGIPNSKGATESLCSFTPFTEGFVRLSLVSGPSPAEFFVGFIGLNNGTNRGGMELFTSLP